MSERDNSTPAPVSQLMGDDWTVDDTDTARAILNYLGIGDDASREPGADHRRDHIAKIIRARIDAAQPAPADHVVVVVVKPLEWIENQSWKHAKTPFGAIYTARPCLATNFLGKWLLSLEIERIGPLHDSEDAAKAAAQADFEARIRAALATTSEGSGE